MSLLAVGIGVEPVLLGIDVRAEFGEFVSFLSRLLLLVLFERRESRWVPLFAAGVGIKPAPPGSDIRTEPIEFASLFRPKLSFGAFTCQALSLPFGSLQAGELGWVPLLAPRINVEPTSQGIDVRTELIELGTFFRQNLLLALQAVERRQVPLFTVRISVEPALPGSNVRAESGELDLFLCQNLLLALQVGKLGWVSLFAARIGTKPV